MAAGQLWKRPPLGKLHVAPVVEQHGQLPVGLELCAGNIQSPVLALVRRSSSDLAGSRATVTLVALSGGAASELGAVVIL